MTPRKLPTRRKLLAILGAGSTLYAGSKLGRAAIGPEAKSFDRSTRTGGPVPLRIDWRETYNGRLVGDAPDTEGWRSEPGLSLAGVLPGDEGTVTLRVTRESRDRDETEAGGDRDGPAARVQLELDAYDFAENGLTEPEKTAGDTTADVGELQDHVDVTIWADGGIVGSRIGACNGRRDTGESLLAEGTLAEVADRTASIPLAGPGSDRDCLEVGASLCIGLRWSIDETVKNVIQGDSLRFDLKFVASGCGNGASSSG